MLGRFQATWHLLGSLLCFLGLNIKEEPTQADIIMANNEIIGIANDRAHNISDYSIFDPNAMNTSIIRLEIIVSQFKFKSMMFQMLQVIGQYSGATNEDPHLHLRQFLEVESNFNIPGISNDVFR